MWFTKARRAANEEDYETWVEGTVTPTLNAFDNATETRATVVALSFNQRDEPRTSDIAYSVQASPGVDEQLAYAPATGVRRLTPVECERLQGFSDGWTDGQADSNRYRQMGNAVTVPVAEWVGRRLMEAATDA